MHVWGHNNLGQLGDGTTTNRANPVTVLLNGVKALSCGGSHSLALLANGTVRAWGGNTEGTLGDGTTTNRTTPVQVQNLSNAIAVAAGDLHNLALIADGTVRAWGRNNEGQLGDGTVTDRLTPVQVQGLSNVVAIATGSFHSLALIADGTVRAWGRNDDGQVGDGSNTNRLTPVQVQVIQILPQPHPVPLSQIKAIAAGGSHSLALRASGTVRTWGRNIETQLGDGTAVNKKRPVQVKDLSNVVALDGGSSHSLALLFDGTVRAWGANPAGQVGLSPVPPGDFHSTAVKVPGLPGVVAMAAGGSHNVALARDGTVLTWGGNAFNQLGDGTTVNRSRPEAVAGITSVFIVAAGSGHSLVIP